MASDVIIVAGFGWVAVGVAIAAIAVLRGRPFWPWLVYGIAFWPLAIVHLLLFKPRVPGTGPIDEDEG
jgi:membrane protein implicated in regulation of membrane protease activity